MDDLLFSEVQIIHSDYIGKYTSEKRKESLKYGPKKRKKKEKKNTEPSVLRKTESNHANIVTQKFLLAIVS